MFSYQLLGTYPKNELTWGRLKFFLNEKWNGIFNACFSDKGFTKMV